MKLIININKTHLIYKANKKCYPFSQYFLTKQMYFDTKKYPKGFVMKVCINLSFYQKANFNGTEVSIFFKYI